MKSKRRLWYPSAIYASALRNGSEGTSADEVVHEGAGELSAVLQRLECNQMLGVDGTAHRGRFQLSSAGWEVFDPEPDRVRLDDSPYLVPLLPVDFHRHAVAGVDLSDFTSIDLRVVNQALAQEGVKAVLTSYLPRRDLRPFRDLAGTFSDAKRRGELPHIVGFALEGPLLASDGGTPRQCVWRPTKEEWRALAECGELGLKYVVLSPDATIEPNSDVLGSAGAGPPMRWIIETLLDAGVSPALGHIRKRDPDAATQAVRDVFEVTVRRAASGSRTPLLSDHLFNDMPLRIKHAWRTSREKTRREDDLEAMGIGDWEIDNVAERLGALPGALIRGAYEGLITLCMNFDGEHVDLAIAREVVRIAGADHIIALTDRVDGALVAGQRMRASDDNRLLYRSDGVVAGGSVALDEQIANMRHIAIAEDDIWKMVSINPCRALGLQPDLDEDARPSSGSFVDASRSRHVFDRLGSVAP